MMFPALLLAGGVLWGSALYSASRTEQGTPNVPPLRTWRRIPRLLSVARALVAAGARITSMVRDAATNEAVGGVSNSLHLEARALDCVCPPEARADVLRVLQELKAQGIVRGWLEHDAGSGMHFHVELTA